MRIQWVVVLPALKISHLMKTLHIVFLLKIKVLIQSNQATNFMGLHRLQVGQEVVLFLVAILQPMEVGPLQLYQEHIL